ncbi:MAG: response regulator [Candidatus Cloacimonetes bacterium]|nr:response regulator [Candidatus Cloacimonadota bacterium]
MGYTILVVDDEVDVTELQKLDLEDEGFDVICENSGYDALKHIMEDKIDLLLTDIAMQDMDGYQLYAKVMELRDDVPVIMMTGFGYDPNHVVVKAKKDGLHDVVFKPFDTDKLVELIKTRLDGGRCNIETDH